MKWVQEYTGVPNYAGFSGDLKVAMVWQGAVKPGEAPANWNYRIIGISQKDLSDGAGMRTTLEDAQTAAETAFTGWLKRASLQAVEP